MSNANDVTYSLSDSATFVQEVLQAHNTRRMRHGSPPLLLDEQLSEQSQQCAQDLLVQDYISASRFPTIGENICIIGTDDMRYTPKGEHPVHFWYQQREHMIFGREPFNHHTYNFSQVVWKGTQLLGVGIARTDNKIAIVCHYTPPGNILGEYLSNVFPEIEPVEQQSNNEQTD